VGREAKAKAERRNPYAKALKNARRGVERRLDAVKLAVLTKEFEASFKTRADLMAGTPEEVVDHAGVATLAHDVLQKMGVDTHGIQITSLFRFNRLQFFLRVSDAAAAEAHAVAAATISRLDVAASPHASA